MSETRRDALKVSVLGALGLSACGGQRLLNIQPVTLYQQPDILVAVDQNNAANSWVFLEYDSANSNYQVYNNSAPLTLYADLGNHPDLNKASGATGIWSFYSGATPITIGGAQLPVTKVQGGPTTATAAAVQAFATNSDVSQNAWNEIGRK